MTSIQSAYIHIPFCKQMCHYCNFVKYYYTEKRATEYLYALEKEIDSYLPRNNNALGTIYIGGGTPTALNKEQLTQMFEMLHRKFDIAGLEEFTIELNPGDIDEEKADILKAYGINRISFGVQVMDDNMLVQLGRTHRVQDVYETVNLLSKKDFSNISLDLIYALPNQTVEQFQRSLKEALAFQLPHYSTYALQIEPQTVFYRRHKKGQLHRPPEEDEVTMYQILKESMAANGIEQYEISNFAMPGFESRHNLTYWNNEYYYGFGAGASGYFPGKRIANLRPLPIYVEKAGSGDRPILEIDEIGIREEIEEELMLGLRKIGGYDERVFQRKFEFPLSYLYSEQLDKLMKQGLLTVNQGVWKLTDEGLLLANFVFEEFILDDLQLEEIKTKML
ncbi:radical SAM family heme chaperone HemW [Oceanobacillus alkalisoli]|uniref:radical SAM family heme chaperone HemW n=1 Tax=Oceanobacillus alkalisoli TaxID=2925113 RepID=UPI001EE3D894|nr:radical SAM family heme chaperone HemW [Oceanobacillus alkalisoli]MCG5103097.1 radical SAM family heme chaperone HemW [Oceanobacillus alkalisoli]